MMQNLSGPGMQVELNCRHSLLLSGAYQALRSTIPPTTHHWRSHAESDACCLDLRGKLILACNSSAFV